MYILHINSSATSREREKIGNKSQQKIICQKCSESVFAQGTMETQDSFW